MSGPGPIPEDVRCVARDIMDNACLGEAWYNNGLVAALSDDIARAILFERERCAQVARRHPGINYTEDNRLKWRLASQHEIASAIRIHPKPPVTDKGTRT